MVPFSLARLVLGLDDGSCDDAPYLGGGCPGEPESTWGQWLGPYVVAGVALLAAGILIASVVQFFRQPHMEGAPPVMRSLLAANGVPFVIAGLAFVGLMGSMFVTAAIFGENAPNSTFRIGQALGLLPALVLWLGARISRARMRSGSPTDRGR